MDQCWLQFRSFYFNGQTLQTVTHVFYLNKGPVWCSGQSERIAPLPSFHGCSKRRLKLNSTHIWDGLGSDGNGPPVASALFLVSKLFWENAGVSKEYLRCICCPFEDKAWVVYIEGWKAIWLKRHRRRYSVIHIRISEFFSVIWCI
jgi:hypothetical protein